MAASTRTWRSVPDAATLDRFAELIVGLGANVQPGQIVELRSQIGREPLTRAVAAAAYRRGARFVDFLYHDPLLRRARVEFAPGDSLEFVPDWHRRRVLAYGEQRCARVALSGGLPAGLVDDLDPERAARDRWPFIAEYTDIIEANTTNWCAVAAPDADWAAVVHPELPPEDALGRLWEQVLYACRVDEADPAVSWRERLGELARVDAVLNERRFDAVHFQGPGTDLTVGLLPSSRWLSGVSETVDGIPFLANIPTEEIFTAPDPARVEGVVTATKPLELRGGTVVRGLVVRFEGGRAVRIDADTGVETLRRTCALDEGGSRLGEVALVDGLGRVGALDTVFFTTLLDENAAAHVALGSCYPVTIGPEDRDRGNRSSIHVDFMLGGDEVDVTALTREGERVPLLRAGRWQI